MSENTRVRVQLGHDDRSVPLMTKVPRRHGRQSPKYTSDSWDAYSAVALLSVSKLVSRTRIFSGEPWWRRAPRTLPCASSGAGHRLVAHVADLGFVCCGWPHLGQSTVGSLGWSVRCVPQFLQVVRRCSRPSSCRICKPVSRPCSPRIPLPGCVGAVRFLPLCTGNMDSNTALSPRGSRSLCSRFICRTRRSCALDVNQVGMGTRDGSSRTGRAGGRCSVNAHGSSGERPQWPWKGQWESMGGLDGFTVGTDAPTATATVSGGS